MSTHEQIYTAVLEGNAEAARKGVEAMLATNADPETLLHKALIPAMEEVGRRFECQEYYVPEMLIAARAMQAGLNVLRPLLAAQGAQPFGRAVLGTVQGDLHDIGKNLVGMMLEGAGFEVTDLGTDVPAAKFVEAAGKGADLLAMSALLTTTMTKMPGVIQALEQAGLRGKVKVMVGGAPLTEDFAHKIGADGYAPDASQAVALAKRLLDAASR